MPYLRCKGTILRGLLLGLLAAIGVGPAVSAANAPQPAKPAGDAPVRGIAAMTVPDGFVVEQIAGPEQISYGMCVTLDPRGRLFICESSGKNVSGAECVAHPECRIRLLEDRDGDGRFESSKVFADKLSLPMGVLWYGDALYVASPPDFLRFRDTDEDGVADVREVVLTGWNVKNTASLHGPFFGPDGWLYLTHGRHGYKIKTREGKTIEGLASRIYRCRADGTGLERIAGGGFDNPVELAFSPAGEMLCTMTYYVDPRQGLNPAGMRDALLHVVEGGVYPKKHECIKEFPHTGDLMPVLSEFPRVAPCGLLRYRGANFGPEYVGNLFSAQFNPHKIQRHVLKRQGATFAAIDTDFLTSTDPDFHPADVVEDADGTLIVVDTGGWYLHACPLSRIAHYDRRGAIYRVRRVAGPQVTDARGVKLNLEAAPAAELVKHIDDARPAVRDRVVEGLVKAGAKAVEALVAARTSDASPRARRNAVWALSRIGTPAARAGVREALADRDPDVRQAAARAVGLAHDDDAVSLLIPMVRQDQPQVQRQAATALGQIGQADALEALADALRAGADRFLEHAIIDAARKIADPETTLIGLDDPSPAVQKAALLVLEQIPGKHLTKQMLRPLLRVDDPGLRHEVLWVAARHRGWSSEVVAAVRQWLTAPAIAAADRGAIQGALIALAGEAEVQKLVADVMTAASTPDDRRILLLEVVARAPLKTLPNGWTAAVGQCLHSKAAAVRDQAVATIRARGVVAFDDALTQIARDPAQPQSLRIAAVAAVVARKETLPDDVFRLLLGQLKDDAAALDRVAAAEALGRSGLDAAQQIELAGRLAAAGPLVRPALLRAFERSREEAVGRALVVALSEAASESSTVSIGQLEKLLRAYPAPVRKAAAPLFAQLRAEDETRAVRMQELSPLLTGGNPFAGRAVFFGGKAACSTCHRVGDEGAHVGPDLSKVGAVRSGRDLLESVVFPSSTFAQGYEPYLIAAEDGTVYEGVIVQQTSQAVTLRTAARALIRLDTATIEDMRRASLSIMPKGLDTTLTRTQLQDLLAYLQSLK